MRKFCKIVIVRIIFSLQENGGQGGGMPKKTGQRVALTPKMAMDSFRFSVLDQAGKLIRTYTLL